MFVTIESTNLSALDNAFAQAVRDFGGESFSKIEDIDNAVASSVPTLLALAEPYAVIDSRVSTSKPVRDFEGKIMKYLRDEDNHHLLISLMHIDIMQKRLRWLSARGVRSRVFMVNKVCRFRLVNLTNGHRREGDFGVNNFWEEVQSSYEELPALQGDTLPDSDVEDLLR